MRASLVLCCRLRVGVCVCAWRVGVCVLGVPVCAWRVGVCVCLACWWEITAGEKT